MLYSWKRWFSSGRVHATLYWGWAVCSKRDLHWAAHLWWPWSPPQPPPPSYPTPSGVPLLIERGEACPPLVGEPSSFIPGLFCGVPCWSARLSALTHTELCSLVTANELVRGWHRDLCQDWPNEEGDWPNVGGWGGVLFSLLFGERGKAGKVGGGWWNFGV